ncbi:hypothetical protein FHS89_002375 [Rubricella aquisinus]|uniref:Apolipoprotein acyltransferase n=1 Tax=Rubricella aquisinus TaxID=2028108 RepID=A0A840X0U0_9RHOB|nr:hypothetical protein [Rubricella aquisinus]MBB5516344.1 hypothetical protein [Rubricella aquisinus]
MLIPIVSLAVLVGGFFGGYRAHKRGGEILDILQYGFGHAVAFGLVALLGMLILDLFL